VLFFVRQRWLQARHWRNPRKPRGGRNRRRLRRPPRVQIFAIRAFSRAANSLKSLSRSVELRPAA